MDRIRLIFTLVLAWSTTTECQRFIYPPYQPNFGQLQYPSGPRFSLPGQYQAQGPIEFRWPGERLIDSAEQLPTPLASPPAADEDELTHLRPNPPAVVIEPITVENSKEISPAETSKKELVLETTSIEEAADVKNAEEALNDLFPFPNQFTSPFRMPAPPVEERRTDLNEDIAEIVIETPPGSREFSAEQLSRAASYEVNPVPPSFDNHHFSAPRRPNGLLPAIPVPLLIRQPNKIEEPVACDMNPWTPWSACTVSCNTGEQARSRSVKVLPVRGGLPCPESFQNRHCNTQACPLPHDCQLANWTPWTACSRQCGGGIQARSRAVIQQAQLGGKPCEPTYQERSCNSDDCPKRQTCVLDPWSPWSACSRMCGGGIQARSRTILTPPADGAPDCGQTHETRYCNNLPCPENCVLSLWEAWSPCTRSCGGGEKARRRIILREGTDGGRQCPQGLEEITLCSLQPCPVDCELGEWEAWTRCSHTCGGGLRVRSRRILRDSVAGGEVCPFRDALKDTQTCNNEHCAVDCQLQSWSPWSDCSAECGGGQKIRERSILRNNQFGGKNCPADSMLKQSLQCNPHPCPLDCRLNDWEPWSACSRTCGGGERYRRRLVLQPPYAGGKECPPASQLRESELCSTNMCPVDCVVGQWDHWSQCSNCGGGVRSRWRPIVRENAAGGEECPIPSELQKVEECFEECPEPEVVVVRQPIVVRQKETQVVKQPVIVRQPAVKVSVRQPINKSRWPGSNLASPEELAKSAQAAASLEEEVTDSDRRQRARMRPNAQQTRQGLDSLRDAAQDRLAAVQRARTQRRRSSRVNSQRSQRQQRRNN